MDFRIWWLVTGLENLHSTDRHRLFRLNSGLPSQFRHLPAPFRGIAILAFPRFYWSKNSHHQRLYEESGRAGGRRRGTAGGYIGRVLSSNLPCIGTSVREIQDDVILRCTDPFFHMDKTMRYAMAVQFQERFNGSPFDIDNFQPCIIKNSLQPSYALMASQTLSISARTPSSPTAKDPTTYTPSVFTNSTKLGKNLNSNREPHTLFHNFLIHPSPSVNLI